MNRLKKSQKSTADRIIIKIKSIKFERSLAKRCSETKSKPIRNIDIEFRYSIKLNGKFLSQQNHIRFKTITMWTSWKKSQTTQNLYIRRIISKQMWVPKFLQQKWRKAPIYKVFCWYRSNKKYMYIKKTTIDNKMNSNCTYMRYVFLTTNARVKIHDGFFIIIIRRRVHSAQFNRTIQIWSKTKW